MYVGDIDFEIGSGDGQLPWRLADDLQTNDLSTDNISSLYESELISGKAIYNYTAASCTKWRDVDPDLTVILSSASSRRTAGKFFDLYDSWSSNFDLGTVKSVVLASTCET
jgi:hypothetical protein